jgi:hypothetical protein
MLKHEVLQSWQGRAARAQTELETATRELKVARYELDITQRLLLKAADDAVQETWRIQADVLQMVAMQAEERLAEQREELALCAAMIAEIEADLAANRPE